MFQKHTGMLIDPSYEGRDILAEALAEGHRLGLEVEVWMEYGFARFRSNHLAEGMRRATFNWR